MKEKKEMIKQIVTESIGMGIVCVCVIEEMCGVCVCVCVVCVCVCVCGVKALLRKRA